MRILYFLYNTDTPATPGSLAWNSPLPMNRKGGTAAAPTFGDYFESIRRFLENGDFEPIRLAVERKSGITARPEEIRIVAEKHGEFYHPAQIVIVGDNRQIPFVLNVAVSDEGKTLIKKECDLLKRLNREFDLPFLPNVYAAETSGSENASDMHMFLGDWFEDCHEFHLSRDSGGKSGVKVWDGVRGAYFLSAKEAFRLRSRMAMILTCYYNPVTFEQIWPWRNAAGDFVVRNNDDGLDVRLVTVRGYRALFGGGEADPEAVVGAMLLFFLNLTLWMRLDREDGVGEIAWADDASVEAVLDGFFRGLEENLPEGFADGFRHYLKNCSPDDLSELLDAVIRAYNPEIPEIRVIRENIDGHAAFLHTALGRV